MSPKPIRDRIKGLRQRRRQNGTWRVWWEPNAEERALGFASVDLDEMRPAWSQKQARKLNSDVQKARKAGGTPIRSSHGRTVDGLIADYLGSRFYQDRKPDTQRSYQINLNAISKKWGSSQVADFSKPVMNRWYESLLAASGPYQAKALLGMMSILFSHAEVLGWRAEGSNPCFRLKKKSGKTRDRHASWDEFDALLAAADQLEMPGMACAIALATLNSRRQKDVIEAELDEFHLTHEDDAPAVKVLIWVARMSKKQNMAVAPVHPEAAPRVLAQMESAAPDQTRLLLDSATGRPFTPDGFRKRWFEVRDRAARSCPSLLRPNLQFRDLRRTFGVWARAGGASKDDVGDVLGNSAGQDATLQGIYMPAMLETAARAVYAVRRPEPDERKKA